MTQFFHEVRQPMTAISNFSAAARLLLEQKLIESSPISVEEISKLIVWIEQINSQSKRVIEIVNQQEKKQLS